MFSLCSRNFLFSAVRSKIQPFSIPVQTFATSLQASSRKLLQQKKAELTKEARTKAKKLLRESKLKAEKYAKKLAAKEKKAQRLQKLKEKKLAARERLREKKALERMRKDEEKLAKRLSRQAEAEYEQLKPRQSLRPFAYFVKSNFEAEKVVDPDTGKVNISKTTQKLSDMYKQLSQEEKDKLIAALRTENEERLEARKKFEEEHGKPKKPASPFVQFFRDYVSQYRSQHPNEKMEITVIMKEAAAAWKQLPKMEVLAYQKKYDAAYEEYSKQLELFRLKHPFLKI